MPLKNIVKKAEQIKILLIPIVLIVFLTSALLLFTAPCRAQSLQKPVLKTIVIDAGHGGYDPGCISLDGRYKEKNVALSVALKLGTMINLAYPSIKVVYTRKSDVFIPLDERAAIANRNKADLFLCIHANSVTNPSATGTETYVMGTNHTKGNFEICKKENSVILLESDYSTKYESFNPNSPESYIIFSLLQNSHLLQSMNFAKFIQDEYGSNPLPRNRGVKQAPLLVLWKSTMPGVLTELGFLSNSNDLEVLISDEGQRKIASSLLKAFGKYKKAYEGGSLDETINIPDTQHDDTKEENKSQLDNQLQQEEMLLQEENKRQQNEQQHKQLQQQKQQQPQPQQKQQPQQTAPAANNNAPDRFFCIQVLSVTKKLSSSAPDLKGRKDISCIAFGGRYKYYVGCWKSRSEAVSHLREIQNIFKGAFVIEIDGDKVIN